MRAVVRSLSLTLVALLGGCGDEAPTPPPGPTTATTVPGTTAAPSPTGPLTFILGEAHTEITGDENVTIDFQLDATAFGNEYDPSDGQLDLTFRGGDDGLLRMTLTFDANGQVTDAFIAIGLGGELAGDENYYYDAFHTHCNVTADPFDGRSVNGTFACNDLPEDSGGVIDVNGTFGASA